MSSDLAKGLSKRRTLRFQAKDMVNSDEEVLTTKEVAALLKLSPGTVYRMAQNGSLPCLQPGGKGHSVRFLRSDIFAADCRSESKLASRSTKSGHIISGPKPKWVQKS